MIMVDLLLDVEIDFFLIFDLVILKILNLLFHFNDWITSLFKQKPLHLIIVGGSLKVWGLVAKLGMEYFTFSLLTLLEKLFVDV